MSRPPSLQYDGFKSIVLYSGHQLNRDRSACNTLIPSLARSLSRAPTLRIVPCINVVFTTMRGTLASLALRVMEVRP